jgi:hypothetical protein
MAAGTYPLKLHAAGASHEIPPGVTLHSSVTGGLSWRSFTYPSYAGNGVCHLLLYSGTAPVTAFLATGNGVYSFAESPTDVAVSPEPQRATISARPDPFRGSTEIGFAVASPEGVSLRVVDVRGRVVAGLIGSLLRPGPHRAAWDAGDLPAGIYFARLRIGDREEAVKLVHFR